MFLSRGLYITRMESWEIGIVIALSVVLLVLLMWMPVCNFGIREKMCGGGGNNIPPGNYDYDLRFTYGQDPRWRYPGGNCFYPYDIYGFGISTPDGVVPKGSWGSFQGPVKGCESAGKKK